jgi:molybdenum-dependent DNA-binding transcriptional regulator ModE
VGGRGGGGVAVTARGTELVRRFRRLEATVQRLAAEQFAEFQAPPATPAQAVKSLTPRKAAGKRERRKRPG